MRRTVAVYLIPQTVVEQSRYNKVFVLSRNISAIPLGVVIERNNVLRNIDLVGEITPDHVIVEPDLAASVVVWRRN